MTAVAKGDMETDNKGLSGIFGPVNTLHGNPVNQGVAAIENTGAYDESLGVRGPGGQPQATRARNVLDDVFDSVGRQGGRITAPVMNISASQGSFMNGAGGGKAQGGQDGNEVVVKEANRGSGAQGM